MDNFELIKSLTGETVIEEEKKPIDL